jgi:hypothetical protein
MKAYNHRTAGKTNNTGCAASLVLAVIIGAFTSNDVLTPLIIIAVLIGGGWLAFQLLGSSSADGADKVITHRKDIFGNRIT